MSEIRIDIPRRDCDTRKSYPALCDYLRMGPGRSLRKLLAQYERQRGGESTAEPPTTYRRTLERWSSEHDWQERADAHDAKIDAWKAEQAKRTLREGLALAHHRVDKLKSIFDRLEQEFEDGALWLEDVKQIGGGEYAEKIEIERYNSALVSDLRGVLDDLAQEVGGRKQRMDVTSDDKRLTDININVIAPRERRAREDRDE